MGILLPLLSNIPVSIPWALLVNSLVTEKIFAPNYQIELLVKLIQRDFVIVVSTCLSFILLQEDM